MPVVPWPVPVYVAPPFVTYAQPAPPPDPPPVVEPKPATGTLILQVQPESAQITVDGYYVGAVVDFPTGLSLSAGPHKIELSEYGYEPVTFDVKVSANDAITYRRVLVSVKPIAARPSPPAAPVYFIPGCYVGNIPPKDAGLPQTCDQSRAVKLN